MGSVSSEEDASSSSSSDNHQSERCNGSYTVSADVSESDNSPRRFPFDPLSSPLCFPTPPALLFPLVSGRDVVLPHPHLPPHSHSSEVELMKERFGKLLLGEDLSGGGKGVSTALALSNAITNLSASVFGELWRLEPLAAQRRKMWSTEMEWLLCVSDSIVELVPEMHEVQGVGTFEVMSTRPRSDLYVNLPALKKLDAMLIGLLDGFEETEFWYVERGLSGIEAGGGKDRLKPPAMCSGRPFVRQEEKWWLPCPEVPENGLSVGERKRLQQCRDCTNQILKAAVAINGSVLAEMETPTSYLEALPKKAKECLGDIIYRYIKAEQFSPECLLDCMDVSSEHQTLEVANRIEAAVHLWRQKDQKRHTKHSKSNKSKWGGKVKGLVTDHDKSQVLAQRAETLLRSLKLQFPGLPQTTLDMSKIQYNKDVGQAILESYSRVLESLAYNIMARIDDLVFVDDATKQSTSAETKSLFSRGGFDSLPIQKRMSPSPFSHHHSPYASHFSTPNFCLSPVPGSPARELPSFTKSNPRGSEDLTLEKPKPVEFERVWSHLGNLSAASAGYAPERD